MLPKKRRPNQLRATQGENIRGRDFMRLAAMGAMGTMVGGFSSQGIKLADLGKPCLR